LHKGNHLNVYMNFVYVIVKHNMTTNFYDEKQMHSFLIQESTFFIWQRIFTMKDKCTLLIQESTLFNNNNNNNNNNKWSKF
jgi:hypothetical protein